MSSCQILGGIPVKKEGLNYLVPSQWWKQFVSINHSRDASSFSVPPLNILEHTDSFLLQFKDDLVNELQFKSNYLKFQSIKISLQPNSALSWTAINPELWKIINKKLKNSHSIFTIIEADKKYDILETTQIQIILCSKTKSDAFVGYVPTKASLALAIRQIGFQIGFIEVVKSKVAFLDKNPEISYTFHQLEKYTIQNGPGTAFLAFNLERSEEQPVIANDQAQLNNIFNRLANESNEAVVGDLNTMVDDSNSRMNEPINNRTISTGAQTPFSFAFSEGFDLDRQYRVKQLFGAKEPEEIQQLKNLAIVKIEDDKNSIGLPKGDDKAFQPQLDKFADELIDSFLKKKIHKQKQKQFELYE